MRKTLLALTARAFIGGLAMCSVAASAHAAPLTASHQVLTNAGAQTVLKAAVQLATQMNAPSAIAVVDPSGTLLAFESLDGVRAGSAKLAIGKARAAALLQRPTVEIEDSTNHGRSAFITAGFLSLRGGYPIRVDNQVVGAIGVAGMNKDNDAKISATAAQQLETAAAPSAQH
jgi:glc operon protein GlcG